MKTTLLAAIFTLAAIATTPSQAQVRLLGTDSNGVIYDVNTAMGAATNPRATGVNSLVGITFAPNGVLYGLTTFGSALPNTLVSINPTTGTTTTIGATGLSNIFEGDLDIDPTTGILYGVQDVPASGGRNLFTIDKTSGAATTVGSIATSGDMSAMAFSASGTLFVLETSTEKLLTVNKSTAAVISSVNLSAALGAVAGMDFNPASGTLYVADGGSDATNNLHTLNPTTGVLTLVGPTGLVSGLAGLAFGVPEPSTIFLAGITALIAIPTRRRKPVGAARCGGLL